MKRAFQKKWISIAAVFLLTLVLASLIPLPDCNTIRQAVENNGIKSHFYYILFSTIAMSVFIPRTPMLFIGGIFFGTVWGTLLNLIASLITAFLFFKIGKSIKSESFENWIKNQKWFIGIDRLALNQGFFFTLALRMSHFIHFVASSLALGLSPVRSKDFIAGTLLGILPGTIAFTYAAESLGCTALNGFEHFPVDLQMKLGISLALLTFVGFLPLLFSYWAPKRTLKEKTKLHVQAHRGVCSEVQENTLAAFERAIEVGADSIELDIHVTRDNKIVVYHDFVLEPEFCTLKGKKIEKAVSIRTLTYDELLEYDCTVSRRLSGENTLSVEQRKIPLLKDVFALFHASPLPHAKHMWIDIEIKSDPRSPKLSPSPKVFCKLLVNEIKKEWDVTRTAVRSFDPRVTLTLRRKYKHLRVIQLTNGGYVDYAKVLRKIKPHVIAPSHKTINQEHIEFIHRAGVEVMPWTANTQEDWKRLIEWGVDGITTDNPRELLLYLSQSNVPQ